MTIRHLFTHQANQFQVGCLRKWNLSFRPTHRRWIVLHTDQRLNLLLTWRSNRKANLFIDAVFKCLLDERLRVLRFSFISFVARTSWAKLNTRCARKMYRFKGSIKKKRIKREWRRARSLSLSSPLPFYRQLSTRHSHERKRDREKGEGEHEACS